MLYATQIAVLDNKKDLKEIIPGKIIDDISFFKAGSGYATENENLYKSMQIGNQGHHYIYYKNQNDNRIKLISELRNEYIGEWSINEFYDFENENSQKIQKLKQKVLYFVVFRNMNLDNIVDQNEVEIFTLRFF